MDDIEDIGVPYLSDVQVSSTVLRRLQLIAPRTREWDNNPAAMSKDEREVPLPSKPAEEAVALKIPS